MWMVREDLGEGNGEALGEEERGGGVWWLLF